MVKKSKSFIYSVKNIHFWMLSIGYGVFCLALFLYSFSQMDLNLTLINHPLFLNFQKPFITLGYYYRLESTIIYTVLMLGLCVLYGLSIIFITKKKLQIRQLVLMVALIVGVLFFSYPAFVSHDIFNYMFDARIVTEYGQNPYLHKALDYPSDPWIRFMHWTHRTYPYGPVWLVVTIPLTFIGGGKFLITLYLFKALVIGSYIATSIFIYKILKKISPSHALAGAAFFALNPLVIIEGIMSAHNDMVMIFFAVLAVYFLTLKKRIYASLLAGLSIGVKFTTIFLAPFVIIGYRPFLAFVFAMLTFAGIAYQIGIQPWYFLWVMPFAALAYQSVLVRIIVFSMTVSLLLRYLPYLLSGSWYPSAVPFQYWITVVAVIISIVLYSIFLVRGKFWIKLRTITWNRANMLAIISARDKK